MFWFFRSEYFAILLFHFVFLDLFVGQYISSLMLNVLTSGFIYYIWEYDCRLCHVKVDDEWVFTEKQVYVWHSCPGTTGTGTTGTTGYQIKMYGLWINSFIKYLYWSFSLFQLTFLLVGTCTCGQIDDGHSGNQFSGWDFQGNSSLYGSGFLISAGRSKRMIWNATICLFNQSLMSTRKNLDSWIRH